VYLLVSSQLAVLTTQPLSVDKVEFAAQSLRAGGACALARSLRLSIAQQASFLPRPNIPDQAEGMPHSWASVWLCPPHRPAFSTHAPYSIKLLQYYAVMEPLSIIFLGEECQASSGPWNL
jgi:hypothetical protein